MYIPLNLRKDDVGALVPAGHPAARGADAGLPMLEFRHSDGGVDVFTAYGSSLKIFNSAGEAQTVECGARILCVAPVPAGCVTVMLAGVGPLELEYEGGAWCRGRAEDIELPLVSAVAMADFFEELDGLMFSPGYQAADRTMTAGHREQLGSALTAAYGRLHSRASAAGCWLQPVVTQVEVKNQRGEVVAWSAPSLVGTLCAVRVTGELAYGTKSALTNCSLSAAPFRIKVEWPGAGLPDGFTALLRVLPQLHPLNPDGICEVRLTRLSADQARLEATLPGVALADGGAAAAATAVRTLAGVMPDYGEVVATLVSGSMPQVVDYAPRRTLKAELAALGRVRSQSNELMPGGLSGRSRFTAATYAVNGDSILWGDISLLPARVPNIAGLTAGAIAEPSSGWVSVKYADGSVDTSAFVAPFTPTAISALVAVDSPGATELTVWCGGKSASVALSPSPGGGVACGVADNLRPVELTASVLPGVPPAKTAAPASLSGAVVTAKGESPSMAVAAAVVPEGKVNGIARAARSRSAWDAASRRFYLLGSAGIYALTLNAARTELTPTLITPGRAHGASVSTPDGVVAAVSSGLMLISGSTARLLLPDCPTAQLAYDTARRELWAVGADGAVTILGDDNLLYRRSFTVRRIISGADCVWLSDAEAYLRTSAVETFSPEGARVEWEQEIECRCRRPYRITWHLYAERVNGLLTLYGDGGAGSPGRETLLELKVAGQLNSPLGAAVVSPPRSTLTAAVTARVSADARLFPPNLVLR